MKILLIDRFKPIHKRLYCYLILSYAFELVGCVLADTASDHLDTTEKLLSAGKYSDALPHFHEAINLDPNNYLTYFKRATVFLALNRPKSALDDLNKALELNQEFTSALGQRASLHVKLGNLDNAHIDYEQLLRREPDNNEALMMYNKIKSLRDELMKVQKLINDSQYNPAIQTISPLLEIMPYNSELLKMRALVLEKAGETQRAISDYKAIAKLSVDPSIYLAIAKLYEKLGDVDESLENVRECLKLDPNYKSCVDFYKPAKKLNNYTQNIVGPREPKESDMDSQKRSKNYASAECAKVVETNPEAKKASYIINEMTDEYMLNPCKSKIWFVIELCETIQATHIKLANYELFSSTPKDFTVYFSDTYPALDWKMVGQFTATDSRTLQTFDLEQVGFGKFIRVELHSHYGSEHYCPINEVKVYGNSMVDEYVKSENPDLNVEEQQKTIGKQNKRYKRKTSAFKVYYSMMTQPYTCGLVRSLNVSEYEARKPSRKKEPPVNNAIQAQPTQQPVVNRTAPLKPSIFVELSNKVKALETSLKIQKEEMERRLNETEVKFEKFTLEFRNSARIFAIVVIAYCIYELMLDFM